MRFHVEMTETIERLQEIRAELRRVKTKKGTKELTEKLNC